MLGHSTSKKYASLPFPLFIVEEQIHSHLGESVLYIPFIKLLWLPVVITLRARHRVRASLLA